MNNDDCQNQQFMKSKGQSTKDILLEHSTVKVNLYVKYLEKYLNIISRYHHYSRIHLYDLLCGEGMYEDNQKGSPVRTLETIERHYKENNRCIDMCVWFNDHGESNVEKGRRKIERVESLCNNMFKPENVKIRYTDLDFVSEVYPKVLDKIRGLKKHETLLLLLDPYGYKDITPEHVHDILFESENENVDLILFHPITYMYRFANKSLEDDDFKGRESLRRILETLLGQENKTFRNKDEFISTLRRQYKEYLNNEIYVDTFTFESRNANKYALFFFTPHVRGFEKMLETKWEIDKNRGQGFEKSGNQLTLFHETELRRYHSKLKQYLKDGEGMVTNSHLYFFGLRYGFLPKHTNEVLRDWKKENLIIVLDDNGEEVKRGFYIAYKYRDINPRKKSKIVTFSIKSI